jgi:hypothetical protein
LLKVTGVPIDHYSYEAVDRLREAAGAILLRSPGSRESLAELGAKGYKVGPLLVLGGPG